MMSQRIKAMQKSILAPKKFCNLRIDWLFANYLSQGCCVILDCQLFGYTSATRYILMKLGWAMGNEPKRTL